MNGTTIPNSAPVTTKDVLVLRMMARASGENGALINLLKDRIYDVSTMMESERAVGDT